MDIADIFVPGKILYLNISLPPSDEPVNKYMILVSKGDYPLLLKINSSNIRTTYNQRLKEFQFKIKPSDYSFLDHESYIDCGNVWVNRISKEEIIEQVHKDPKRDCGDISKDHKNEIIRLTKMSKSISPVHKRIIEAELKP